MTLTVKDNQGASSTPFSAPVSVTVPVVSNPVTFRAAAHSAPGAAKVKSVVIPATAHAGDTVLLFVTDATAAGWSAPTGVSGLTSVDTFTNAGVVTTVYKKALAAGDVGATVSISAATAAKAVLTAGVYANVSAASPAAGGEAHAADTATTSHVSPTVTAQSGDVVLSYWADKSSATSTWTAPASVTARDTAIDNGSGRFGGLLADSGTGVSAGTYGGLTATTDAQSSQGNMVTIALSPSM